MRLDVGLLILRFGFGGLMVSHGLMKLQNFKAISPMFMNFMGMGTQVSLALAIFAELFCASCVMLGLKTRWAAIPVAFTMLIAAAIAHAGDPFQKKELAVLFLFGFTGLAFTGGGRFSADQLLRGRS